MPAPYERGHNRSIVSRHHQMSPGVMGWEQAKVPCLRSGALRTGEKRLCKKGRGSRWQPEGFLKADAGRASQPSSLQERKNQPNNLLAQQNQKSIYLASS